MYLKTMWFGCFLIEDSRIRDHILFPMQSREIRERMSSIRNGMILEEEDILSGTVPQVQVDERRLLKLENAVWISSDGGEDRIAGSVTPDPDDFGFDSSLLREALIGSYQEKLEKVLKEREIVELISALDDINKVINLLTERELELTKVVTHIRSGSNDYNMKQESPEEEQEVVVDGVEEVVVDDKEKSEVEEEEKVGDEKEEVDNEEEEKVDDGKENEKEPDHDPMGYLCQQLGERIRSLVSCREELVTDITRIMKDRNPTLSALAGELLGARLIALAGGRDRLARLPSSTIQILGAEKAFFGFRKTGKGMPKHGIIYQHPMIRGSPKGSRGKIARAMAGKLAIAARVDYYDGRDEGEALGLAVREKVESIRSGGKKK